MKKLLLFISFACLIIGGNTFAQSVPTTNWSDNASTLWYNDATTFTISTAADLAGLSQLVAGGNKFVGKTINIGADIDLGMHLFSPIGLTTVLTFSGTFNGNNHTISNGFIVTPSGAFTGFFGQVTDATIKNLKFNNLHVRGKDSSAGIAGGMMRSTITDCHITGLDLAAPTGANIGGIAGSLITNSHVLRCSVTGMVTGEAQVGGLIGGAWDLATITQSYSTAATSAQYLAGGLVGYTAPTFFPNRPITINNCFSTGNVAVSLGRAGGFYGGSTGELIIKNSYSTGTVTGPEYIGALIGTVGFISTENLFWDAQASGITNLVGLWEGPEAPINSTSKMTSEMKSEAMVTLLNAAQPSTPWTRNEAINNGYPTFQFALLSTPGFATELAVSIYPTLVDAVINVDTTANLSGYSIYSISGKQIATNTLSNTAAQISAEGLAAGVYILQITTDQGKVTRKFVKN